MTLPYQFMEAARTILDPETFDRVMEAAVASARQREVERPVLPKAQRVDKPRIAARIEADLNDRPRPPPPPPFSHVTERLDERLDISVGPNELGSFTRFILQGGPNVRIQKNRLDLIQEIDVSWMGKDFTVIFNRSRRMLVTAYARTKRRATVRTGPKEKTGKALIREALQDMEG